MPDYKVNKRVKELMEHLKLNPHQFASSIGHERSDKIYNIVANKTGVSLEILQSILKKYKQVSITWLVMGVGDIDAVKKPIPESVSEIALLKDLVETKNKLITSLESELSRYNKRK